MLPCAVTGPVRCVADGNELYAALAVAPEEKFVNIESYVCLYQLSPDQTSWVEVLRMPMAGEGQPSALLSNRNGLFLVLQYRKSGDQIIHLTRHADNSWIKRVIGFASEFLKDTLSELHLMHAHVDSLTQRTAMCQCGLLR